MPSSQTARLGKSEGYNVLIRVEHFIDYRAHFNNVESFSR